MVAGCQKNKMNFDELTGKKFAIIAIGEDEKGKTEAAAFIGHARWNM